MASGRGQAAGAPKAYEAAMGLPPDLTAVYCSWGVAYLRHSDLAGTYSRLKDANQRGPH